MIIREDEMVDHVLAILPGFKPKVEKIFIRFGKMTPFKLMTELSGYVDQLIRDGQLLELPELFALIERFMVEGEPDVINSAATCFLENLQNFETPAQAWVPLLGKESQAYCRAWDEFTGTRTEGL